MIQRRESNLKQIAIIRIEELYPFPSKNLNSILNQYTNVEQLIWCQEEPKNQGAWDYFEPRFAAKLDYSCVVNYVGREPSSAPAVGSGKVHAQQQKKLVKDALGLSNE